MYVSKLMLLVTRVPFNDSFHGWIPVIIRDERKKLGMVAVYDNDCYGCGETMTFGTDSHHYHSSLTNDSSLFS